MWEIFKRKKGKEFYRDSIAFFSYNPDDYEKIDEDVYQMDDEELSYIIEKKLKK